MPFLIIDVDVLGALPALRDIRLASVPLLVEQDKDTALGDAERERVQRLERRVHAERGGRVEPARALVDLVAMPVRMVLEPAWTKTQGPSMYKRWHSGEWLAGPRPEPSAGESDS